MGQGATWGGSNVPLQLTSAYGLYAGFDQVIPDDVNVFATDPLYTTYNLRTEITRLWNSSGYRCPYAAVAWQDPNPDLDEVATRFWQFDSYIASLDPSADWLAASNTVKTQYDSELSWTEDIADIAETFDVEQTPQLMRSEARMAAGLAQTGAIYGSAYWGGIAFLEAQHNNKVAGLRATLTQTAHQDRLRAIAEMIGQIMEQIRYRIEAGRAATHLKLEMARMNIVANDDYSGRRLDSDVKAEEWNLELLQRGMTGAPISGAPVVQKGTPWEVGVASIMLSAFGAAVGSPALMKGLGKLI